MRTAVLCGIGALLLSPCAGQEERSRAEETAMTAILPKGYELELELKDALDSRTARPGDAVRARLARPVVSGQRVLIPEGAAVSGRVTEVKGPTMGMLKADVRLVFTRITERRCAIPIEASAHFDFSAMAVKGGKMAGSMAAKEVAKRAIPVLGTVFLIQDVAGAAKFVTEDKEITIPAGTRMKVLLDGEARFPVARETRASAPP